MNEDLSNDIQRDFEDADESDYDLDDAFSGKTQESH